MSQNYWNNKKQNAILAQAHTQEMYKSFSKEINDSVLNTKIYSNVTGPLPEGSSIPEIYLDDIDTVSAIYKYAHLSPKMAALNFASYKNPGGKFIQGSSAQEECLCHESFLYNVLSQFPQYYSWNIDNKNKALYFHRALYSPGVIFCREGLPQVNCDIITCAAPNKRAAQKYCYVTNEENLRWLNQRIKYVLDIAAENNVDTLILGAYGCGVFGQDPHEVADIFMTYINYYLFKTVIFAIPGNTTDNYLAFSQCIKNQ